MEQVLSECLDGHSRKESLPSLNTAGKMERLYGLCGQMGLTATTPTYSLQVSSHGKVAARWYRRVTSPGWI